jgi:hypothetical protein
MSSDIHVIEDEIKRCESRIKILENQLKDAHAERQRWKRQLEFAINKELDHFNKCPVEILVEIFQIYLTPRHRHIRTLLLVCKKWYELVMKVPSLWGRIDLYFSGPPSFDEPFDLIPYIRACKQRSKNISLDIDVDIRQIGNARDYHGDVLHDLIIGKCTNCLFETLSNALDYSERASECPVFEERMKELAKTMHVLVGDDSKDMARWSSFRILLPFYEKDIRAIAPACTYFNGPTNSLRSIVIEGLDDWIEVASGDDGFQQSPVPFDWSHVERLKTRVDINLIPIQWSSIKHLDIFIDTESGFMNMSKLTSLETLAITTYAPHTFRLNPPKQGNVRHHFPYLRSMIITGDIPNVWFETFNFDVPSLKHFSMHLLGCNRVSPEPFDMRFPRISPRTVSFRGGNIHNEELSETRVARWNQANSQNAVRQVLHHFSSAEQITFEGFDDEIIRTAISGKINNGQRCSASVYTEKNGDFFRLHHTMTVESSRPYSDMLVSNTGQDIGKDLTFELTYIR